MRAAVKKSTGPPPESRPQPGPRESPLPAWSAGLFPFGQRPAARSPWNSSARTVADPVEGPEIVSSACARNVSQGIVESLQILFSSGTGQRCRRYKRPDGRHVGRDPRRNKPGIMPLGGGRPGYGRPSAPSYPSGKHRPRELAEAAADGGTASLGLTLPAEWDASIALSQRMPPHGTGWHGQIQAAR